MLLNKISVVIPVFNAEKYIRRAVESVVNLSEVGEVILVEDKSPDDALAICLDLEKEFSKVKLYRHPKGENRGAGASRNLGLKNAKGDFIAFLDADDWYLPNRFEAAKRLFKDDQIDGVYEPVGTFFHDEEGHLFGRDLNKEEGDKIITFPKKRIKSSELFTYLLSPTHGSIHINGLTLRKTLLGKAGDFSEDLKLHQDTDFWIRCSYYGKLVAPKNPVPVAVRGVHQENRIKSRDRESKSLLRQRIYDNFKDKKLTVQAKKIIFKNAVSFDSKRKFRKANVFLKYAELLKISFKYLPIFNPFSTKKNNSASSSI